MDCCSNLTVLLEIWERETQTLKALFSKSGFVFIFGTAEPTVRTWVQDHLSNLTVLLEIWERETQTLKALFSKSGFVFIFGTAEPTDLKKYGATTVVRVCEVTYDKAPLEKDGITVVDWPFDDGAPPPGKVVEDWLSLLKNKFCDDPGSCVAVHCVAGLGRAPVLVALALIESGMKYEDAIQFIRQKRRGAINSKQLTYLEKYRPKQRLRFKDPHAHKTKCCIM
uniref:Protein tyrosine phosphatase type IVA 3 n=1 Tax=Bos indicus x Bos taurus TaxID=30522 RepID=A0A4W2EG13_BOBOX